MGYIFISYSHKDITYAHKLQRHLLEQGYEAWLDDRIDYGTHWPTEIELRLRNCEAFLLIMSPNSYESEWVQNELNLARKLKKPIFPLLLEGEEWWHIGTTQFANVTGGKLPDTKFYVRLAEVSLRKWSPEAVEPRQTAKKESLSQNISLNINGDVSGTITIGDENRVHSVLKRVEQEEVKIAEKAIHEKTEYDIPEKRNFKDAEKQTLPISILGKKDAKKQRLKTEYIVIIIVTATIAGLLSSPLIKHWFSPVSAPTVTLLPSATSLLVKTQVATNLPLKTPTVQASPSPNLNPEAVIEGIEPNAEITLWTFWLSPTFDNYIKSTIARFNEAYPEVKVTWTDHQATFQDDLKNAFAAGNAPDVINLSISEDWVNNYATQGLLMPLDDVMPKAVVNQYFPNLWNQHVIGGKHYQLPWYQGITVDLVNKQILDNAGLKVEDFPKTIDELPAFCKTIKQKTGTLCDIRLAVNDLLAQMILGLSLMRAKRLEFVVGGVQPASSRSTNHV